ncbi:MAG TPA: DNA repair protein RecO [Candidatus Brocadiia bacterium]|nr:DNA repair protein RecO [Candidatus Brocadiia bacterium]
MAYVNTRGLSLRRSDYSETSQTVTFFAPDLGRINVLAKGIKRGTGKRPASPIDLLELDELVILQKAPGALSVLVEHRSMDRFNALRGDLARIRAGLYAAELLLAMTHEGQSAPALFDRTVEYLRSVDRHGANRLLTAAYELSVLDAEGYLPQLNRCAECGGPISGGTRVVMASGQVSVACPACARGGSGAAVLLRPPTVKACEGLLRMGMVAAVRMKADAGMIREISTLTRGIIRNLLGRDLRTWRFL